ncbi:MAG: lysozyme [Clostridium sp.]
MKKFKVLALVMAILMIPSVCANASSSKKSKDGDYTKEEIDNRRPGFYASDIAKSNQYVNSGKNTFSAPTAPSVDDEEEDDYEVIENYNFDQVGPINVNNITSITAVPGTDAKWGRTKDGKWIFIEYNQPGTGWKLVNGDWYYMDSNGIMQTGWINPDGSWYYLYPSGRMARNTYIGSFYVGDSGAMI